MSGDGKIAESIKQLFIASKRNTSAEEKCPDYDFTQFKRPPKNGQLELF
jgi:hypothetical protein